MSDTARDYQTTSSATTDGMDDLFADSENHIESVDSHLVLTVSEASTYLKKPISTIYRRIKAGKFKTQQGDDGALRIILPTDNSCETQVITAIPLGENQKPDLVLADSRDAESENQPIKVFSTADLDRLLELVAEKDNKLEAATYRVGYLESRLEDRESQIKLLTDREQKSSWWTKFSSWFLKGQ